MPLTKEQNEALMVIDSQNAVAGIMDTVRTEKVIKRRSFTQLPEKIRLIDCIKLPAAGGMLTYFQGVKYPMNGFPVADAVDRIDIVKSTILALLSSFSQMFRENKLKTVLLLFFFRKEITVTFNNVVMAMAKLLGDYTIQDRYCCPMVQEIQNAFVGTESELGGSKKEKIVFSKLGRIICTVLQYDDSYRYRIQHVLGQIDRQAYKLDPMRELGRVVDIGVLCENDERIKSTWKAGRLALKVARYIPAFRQRVICIFRRISPERVRLSVEDYYYARDKTEYDWSHGLPASILKEAESWEAI